MSDFQIRDTGAVAKAWQADIKDVKPGLSPFRTTTDARIDQSKEAFKSFFDDNVKALKSFVPLQDVGRFEAAARASFNGIVEATFDTLGRGAAIDRTTAHTALVSANTRAREAIDTLSHDYFKSTTRDWEKLTGTGARTVEERAGTAAERVEKSPEHTVAKDSFATATRDLDRYLTARLDQIEKMAPAAERADVREAGAVLKRELLDQFAESLREAGDVPGKDGQVYASDFRAAVRDTHVEAQRELLRLGRDYQSSDTPQISLAKDGKVSLIRKAPPLENLVLAGGGAKGVGNPPALVELAQTGVIDGLKQIVGTSAGALTASCLASGMSADDFQELMDKTDMNDLKGDVEGFKDMYPGFDTISGQGTWAQRAGIRSVSGDLDNSAQQALKLLDHETAKSVGDFVDQVNLKRAVRDGTITKDEAERLEVFKGLKEQLEDPDFKGDRSESMVTFNDLRILSKLNPEQFKELTLTGFNKTTKAVEYFNADTNPDLPIAFAGRISMSIPLYFQTVKLGDEYVDGGIGSNMPSEAVLKKADGGKLEGAELEQARAKTMLMVFDEDGAGLAAMHTPKQQTFSKEWTYGPNKLISNATGADYVKTQRDDQAKTTAAGPNVHVVFHGDVGTFDLDATQAQKEFGKQMATLRTLEQIEARQNQAYQVQVANVAEAFGQLSSAEKRAVHEAGAPTAEQYPKPAELLAAQDLYDLCRAFVEGRR